MTKIRKKSEQELITILQKWQDDYYDYYHIEYRKNNWIGLFFERGDINGDYIYPDDDTYEFDETKQQIISILKLHPEFKATKILLKELEGI